jgi:hypothetical protein
LTSRATPLYPVGMEGFSFRDTALFLPLRLGPTAGATLQEFVDIDVSAEDLVRILRGNQAYKDLFARFVNQKTQPTKEAEEGKNKPSSPTHRLIGLLGMIGSRNLILALRMHKALHGTFPTAQDGSLDLNTPEYLKRALEAEELFLRAKLDYSETAFAAACYFDWLFLYLAQHPDAKRLLPYCEQVWKRALRTGLIAYFLAREVKSLSPKQSLAAGFLVHGGKLLLAARIPDYPEAEGKADEAAVTPLLRLLEERDRWGASQEEAGAHSLRYFDLFLPLAPAIRFFREPYALKGKDSVQYDLASLLYLADAMARSWKIPADEKDPVIQEWAHPSLKHLKIPASKLIATMKSAMTVR